MTAALIARLRELYAKATPGKWTFALQEESEPDAPDVWAIHADDTSYEATLAQLWSGEHENEANAALIAESHNALPTLLDALAAKDAELAGLREARDNYFRDYHALRELFDLNPSSAYSRAERLEAELAAVSKDAERWRYWKEHCNATVLNDGNFRVWIDLPTQEEARFNAAIDDHKRSAQ